MEKNLLNLSLAVVGAFSVGIGCNGLPGIQVQNPQPTATPVPAATAAPSATVDTDNAKLLEKLEELEKKLEQAQKQGKTLQPPVIKSSGTIAWVNSPGDGFLALRSDQSPSDGYRILQIPHGAAVRVLSCQSYSQSIGGRTGRWCRVSYGGSTGWAFDGWLVY